MKVAVLLSGCGVYDGSEIHESVFALLALAQNNLSYVCVAPNIKHHHVINHLSGEESFEERNVLVESARIARGDVISVEDFDFDSASALVIPGGFGAAKNLSDWAFNGPNSSVLEEVRELILLFLKKKKPVVSLCISPTLIAKSLEKSGSRPKLTVGSVGEKSEYNIFEIKEALSSLGSQVEDRSIREILYDDELKIISAPCYMMEGTIDQIYRNTKMAIDKLKSVL